MILVLARKRSELNGLAPTIGLAAFMALIGTWMVSGTSLEVHDDSTLGSIDSIWVLQFAMLAFVRLRELRGRWDFFELSLPVEPPTVARAQLLAALGMTCLPPAAGMTLWCLLRFGKFPPALPWVCLATVAGLALFTTSLLAWQRPGVRFPLHGIVQGVLLLAGSVLTAFLASALIAGLLSVGFAAAITGFLWIQDEREVRGLRRGLNTGAMFRQRFATPGLALAIAFYANRLDGTVDFFLLFLFFFQFALMRIQMAPVRILGYLPLARRIHATRAVLLPLLAILVGVGFRLFLPIGELEWGHREPRLELAYRVPEGRLELRPSSMLWQFHLGSDAPMVTRPDGSTFCQKLVPVVPGLSLRNPYEVGPGASDEFVVQRASELARDLYGTDIAHEEIQRRLLDRTKFGSRPDGRFPEAFPDFPRMDRRNLILGALVVCLFLWSLAVWAAFMLPSWPLLPRRSLLVRMQKGAANIGVRTARFFLAATAILVTVFFLTAFHDGRQLASQVLLYQVGSLLTRPAVASAAAILVALYAAYAIRRADEMDAVRFPLESAAAAA